MKFPEMPVQNFSFFERSFVPAQIACVSLQRQKRIVPKSRFYSSEYKELRNKLHTNIFEFPSQSQLIIPPG